jgi:hypothetical protein
LLVCFVMAPSSQELEPPANPGRFSAGLPCLSAQPSCCPNMPSRRIVRDINEDGPYNGVQNGPGPFNGFLRTLEDAKAEFAASWGAWLKAAGLNEDTPTAQLKDSDSGSP